ncbi:hypothetical protein TCAL_11765 [Tigriopus californicus]|uniref:Uncharacterized protein n=1 Tax=Tigriopus californicus TaxID=6832 RepID=A0A553NNG2_TIGCA|nr:uncharacterized protein LOC131879652 [Tigriopus californicus]TRY66993.1 hypothetical protein TCAL_11765 [Tigriopus californicus]|eukprot:TCALIF_11765-PA protein Name:"Protein of unknown function" AED:0.03 eAED:0.03 QI:23/1/0.5/1/1/1/2/0/127
MGKCFGIALIVVMVAIQAAMVSARLAPDVAQNCFQIGTMEDPHHADVFRRFARCISETVRHMAGDFQRRELTRATKNAVIATRGRRQQQNYGSETRSQQNEPRKNQREDTILPSQRFVAQYLSSLFQ